MLNSPKIKICGLSREKDIEYVNILKPDFIGFVFAKSKRKISFQEAKKLSFLTAKNIKKVGVFINEDIEKINFLWENKIIDIAQLHGDEDNSYIKKLIYLKIPTIKAVKIINSLDVEKAKTFNSDYLLLDAGNGNGKTFDWNLLKNFNKKYFLAGGLTPENIENAIKICKPIGVDVSSGVETNNFKDFNKIKLFIKNTEGGFKNER